MGIFDTLTQTEVFGDSKYFQDGRYIVAIAACKLITGGHKGDSFVIEADVRGAISEIATAPRYGEKAAQVWNASGDKRDVARNTWMGFLCAAYGVKVEDYSDDAWKEVSIAVMDQNVLRGVLLYLDVFTIITKVKKQPFTKHAWRGAPTAEQLVEFGLDSAGTPISGGSNNSSSDFGDDDIPF